MSKKLKAKKSRIKGYVIPTADDYSVVFGPFTTAKEAAAWGDKMLPVNGWFIKPIIDPYHEDT